MLVTVLLSIQLEYAAARHRLKEIYPYRVETFPGLSSLDTRVAGAFLGSPIVELG